ncbi:tetratricopeptide repeat protein [Nostoc sp. ChiQUE01b]|uniref:tetratricopeptide repeat protein n=1 Tax=Nostoc sp. ChiQUE01b TaxID=3075376 RepID=UPI002AD4DC6B|nr:tetratricopeptide repeat protein [Nostoc sp. ChiQUE01b]MDZ8260543.1 tetratricopeptide repeat protein [Nostoc sp. ChiQUE01b]
MDTTNISESKVKSLIQMAVQKHLSGQKDDAESLDKTAVAEILELAVQQQRDNRLVESELLYIQVLEKQPDNSEALHGLGMLAEQMGQYQTAEQCLSAASQVQPDSVKTWFSLGNLRLAQKQFSEAEKAYRQALVLLPNSLQIYNNLGYTLQEQGLFEEAINYYQKALELKPDFIEAEASLGNALHAQGKLSVNQKMHYAQLNNKLGVARKKALDLKNAVTCYKQAIALQPNLLEAHYNLGLALQEQGEFEEAIASYQKLLELNPNDGEVYLNLGKIYQQQDQYQKAVSAYQQGLKLINPHYAKALAAGKDAEISQKISVTPPIPQGEVIVGRHRFLAIPPIAHDRKRPFWSVVLPIYSTNNRTNYLFECLVSVLRQWSGEEEMEIVVVDDASPVPLKDLVDEIGQGIIRYYRNSQNRGAYQNFNTAVAISQGQWIHLLHDDDYVLPGFYARLRQSLETCSPSVGAAFTGYENINEQGKVVFSQQIYGDNRGIAENFIQMIGVGNPLNMPAVVVRRSTYEHLGGYLPELNYTGDWEFYKRVTAFYDWWYEPEILARYRHHTHNITTESILSGSQSKCLRRAIEISEDYIPVEITAKSRSHHFNYCLLQARIPLQFDKVEGALRMVQEALKIDRSSGAVANLFTWLQHDEAALLRDEITSRLLSLSLNNNVAKSGT